MTVAVAPAPSTFSGSAEAVLLVVLLSEFAMLRAPLTRSQVRLYAFQSLAVSALAIFAGATSHAQDLYALAGLSFLLKVVLVPRIMLRLLSKAQVDLSQSHRLGVATMVMLAIAVSIFAVLIGQNLPIRSGSLPTPSLGLALAVVLVAFLLVILRTDVVSQAVGFFSLENGVSVAGLVLAAGLPLMVELAFLFDLLVAVVVLGILMRVHHARSRTLSTEVLDRLRG